MVDLDSKQMCRLFVYGSLKRGGANHALLVAAGFLRTVRTAPSFALRVIEGYPALVPGARSICGELFAIPVGALPALDDFEGSDYERHPLALEDGSMALAYLARAPNVGIVHDRDHWP